MKRLARAAIVTTLRDELERRGSWAGETHLQKALFVLQEGASVPLAYNFILYKHGPFAFDLREDLNAFRSDGFITLRTQPYPYGPRLVTTEIGHDLQRRFPKTLGLYRKRIETVAQFLGNRGVTDLERIGTALLMIRDFPGADDNEISRRVRNVKPHVQESEAELAIKEVRRFLVGATKKEALGQKS
jgi:hypothetical protein